MTNTGIVFAGNSIVLLVTLATLALNARAIGPIGLGILALIQNIAALVRQIAGWDTWQPLIKLGATAIERQRPDELRDIVVIALLFDVASGLVAAIIGTASVVLFAHVLGIPSEYCTAAAVYTLSLTVTGYTSAIGLLRLFDRFFLLTVIQVLAAVATLCMVLALLVLKAPLTWYIVIYALMGALANVCTVFAALLLYVRRDFPPLLQVGLLSPSGRKLFGTFLRFSGASGLTQTLNALRNYGDVILLGAFTTSGTVGLYTAAARFAAPISRVSDPLRATLFPEVAQLHARNELGAARHLLRRCLIASAAIAITLMLGYTIGGHTILVWILGREFEDAVGPMIMLAIGQALYLAGFMNLSFVQNFRGPIHALAMSAGAFGVFAILACALIPRYGLAAAGAAQIGYSLVFLVGGILMLRSLLMAPSGT